MWQKETGDERQNQAVGQLEVMAVLWGCSRLADCNFVIDAPSVDDPPLGVVGVAPVALLLPLQTS